jgi:hypothetical protein
MAAGVISLILAGIILGLRVGRLNDTVHLRVPASIPGYAYNHKGHRAHRALQTFYVYHCALCGSQ